MTARWINIISGGSVTNMVAGSYKGAGASIDGITTTITGTAGLVLGSASGLWSRFANATTTGETINAGALTGSLIYASSGKGDKIVSGSGNDTIYVSKSDQITTGAGSDIIVVNQGPFESRFATGIAFIKDFSSTDKIRSGSGLSAAASVSDDTASSAPGLQATLADAAKRAFQAYVGTGHAEATRDVVLFKYSGQTYDAISRDGSFATSGYAGGPESTVTNIIVGVTLTATQTVNSFAL